SRARNAEIDATEKKDLAEKKTQELQLEAAEGARRRGQLRDRLRILKQAIDAGHPDRIHLRLDEARTHAALAEPEEVVKILDELDASGEAKELEGSILLLRGYTTMGGKTQQGFELISKALTKKLPKAE